MSKRVEKELEQVEVSNRKDLANELLAVLNFSRYIREELLHIAPNCVPFVNFLVEGLSLELLLQKNR